jgi:hypothetical protein
MDKDGAIQILCGFPEDIERRMIKVAAIGAMTIFVRIDVRADFGPMQSELAHATSQFLRGKIGVLQWKCPQTGKPVRVRTNYFGDVIVEDTAEI